MEKPATIMTEQEIKETLTRIARADISDHLIYRTENVEIGKDSNGQPQFRRKANAEALITRDAEGFPGAGLPVVAPVDFIA